MNFPSDIALPPARKALWRSMKLGYQAEPWLLVIAFAIVIGAAVPDALFALWLKLLAQGIADDSRSLLIAGCAGLGGSAAGSWLLKVAGERVQRKFQDRATITLESHVARCKRPSRRSSTRSGPNTWTASPSSATRSSPSATSTALSSQPSASSSA